MKHLVAELHDMGKCIQFYTGLSREAEADIFAGFKAGIYSSAGTQTCKHHFGSLGFESIDAQKYAEWGFDMLKYDNCYNQGQSGTAKLSFDRYKVMADALNATGRPFWYAMCNWVGHFQTCAWLTYVIFGVTEHPCISLLREKMEPGMSVEEPHALV